MNSEIRKRFAGSRNQAGVALDVFRQSAERYISEQRERQERLQQAHTQRAQQYWLEAGEAINNDREGE